MYHVELMVVLHSSNMFPYHQLLQLQTITAGINLMFVIVYQYAAFCFGYTKPTFLSYVSQYLYNLSYFL